ncbi:hypothetical protein [Roseateles noduli]|jgi:hypothetical protein|uniref:hypothetical protein n=1 Tax=Roseateles noduli TaxID=2052484 RepID=UPI003D660B71
MLPVGIRSDRLKSYLSISPSLPHEQRAVRPVREGAIDREEALTGRADLPGTHRAQVEEEIFDPEIQAALFDKELVPEAKVELRASRT